MNTAEKIGLFSWLGWMTDHSFLMTLATCWIITPGLMIFPITPVFESRWLPLDSGRQFTGFFPGDLFLGLGIAILLWRAQSLPSGAQFYNSFWFHMLVLVITLTIAVVMTYQEWKSGVWLTRAMYSPTKLYHNIVLYGLYGYVAAVTGVAVLVAAPDRWWMLVALLHGLIWAGLVMRDNSSSESVKASRVEFAHVAYWQPIWRR